VIKGEAVGRTIGFPTANLRLVNPPKIKPGVYVALITLARLKYLGLAYFGPRYIFGEKPDSFEVYIFNFNRQIYGEKLTVKLLRFLRKPLPVANLKKLKQLLEQDMVKLDQWVILVDKQDKILGIEEKSKAHQGRAKLHRAISVQLFNQKGELLIQQRAKTKPLFAGEWANTVCTDVRPYENYLAAANRRLQEEFGLKANLKPGFKFFYTARWGKNSEWEIDQAFFGRVSTRPRPSAREIADWKYISLSQAKRQIKTFAPWFQLILKKIKPSDIVIS